MTYRMPHLTLKMVQLLSLLRILRHWGALLALMYLDQHGNIGCNQPIYEK